MLSTRAGILFLAFTMVAGLQAGQPVQNPYSNAKVGDWVKLRAIQTLAGEKTEFIYKRVVSSVSETEVVIEEETSSGGKVEASRTRVDISKPRPTIMTDPAAKIVSTKSGFERLRAAGKDLVCALSVQTDVAETKDSQISRTVKTWTSPEIPVDGMARTELERKGSLKGSKVQPPVETIVVELVEFGRK